MDFHFSPNKREFAQVIQQYVYASFEHVSKNVGKQNKKLEWRCKENLDTNSQTIKVLGCV